MTLIAPRLLRLLFAGVGGGPKGRKHLIVSYSMTDGGARQCKTFHEFATARRSKSVFLLETVL